MNREIKFRAWDKGADKMYHDFDQNTPGVKLGQSIHLKVYETGLLYNTLMQYTGLKDRNGKEIYEGDIVWHGYSNEYKTFADHHYVYYAEDKAMFYLARLGKEQFNAGAITHKVINGKRHVFEVVGNIYETPELLQTMR